MKILVLNAGSSSLKYQLVDMSDESVKASGNCERIGIDGRITHKIGEKKFTYDINMNTHNDALLQVVKLLSEGKNAVIDNIKEIDAIGHRIVAGNEKISHSVEIDSEILQMIEDIVDLAPLHTPSMITGIKACKEIFGEDLLQAAVFDTAFHSTMPPKAYIYPIPYEYYEKYSMRRYGYHGTSHRYVSIRLEKLLGRSDMKIVSCHLGNGSSITAINSRKSVDTTMGYTPLEGLMMGTRSGTIDPGMFEHIAKKEGFTTIQEVSDVLNKKSGLLGISGVSSDDREVGEAAANGNKRAILAGEIVRYQVKKYIGAFTAAMNGMDAIIFTGGIGEKSVELREEVCNNMDYLGVVIDKEKNKQFNGKEAEISAENSRVKVWIVPTNEELMIARETKEVYDERKLR